MSRRLLQLSPQHSLDPLRAYLGESGFPEQSWRRDRGTELADHVDQRAPTEVRLVRIVIGAAGRCPRFGEGERAVARPGPVGHPNPSVRTRRIRRRRAAASIRISVRVR